MGKIIRNEKIITPTQYIEKIDESSLQSLIDGSATEIVVPDGTEMIKPYAFFNMKNLTNISIPNSIKRIGMSTQTSPSGSSGYVFAYCSSLEEIDLSNIIYDDNDQTYSQSRMFYYCSLLKNVKLPQNITNIANYMFAYCSQLTTIQLPDSVNIIENYAFNNCSRLLLNVLPENIQAISSNAFYGCEKITIKEIPIIVNHIYANTFFGCTSLTQMNFKGNIVQLDNQAFFRTNITKFTFPNNTVIPTLQYISAIPNGASYIGQIAIPNSLYDTWTTATNWSSLTQAQWVRFIDSWDETITVEGDYALKTDTDLADVRHLSPAS